MIKSTVSLNDCAYVRLTEFGVGVLAAHGAELVSDSLMAVIASKMPEPGHWWREQLWTLMNVFGSVMHCGGNQPFEGNEVSFEEPTVLRLVRRCKVTYEEAEEMVALIASGTPEEWIVAHQDSQS